MLTPRDAQTGFSTTGNGYCLRALHADKFTVKKCLWARFIIKEQKLITTGNKEISFYEQRATHSRPGQFSQMAFQALEEAFKIAISFLVGEQCSDFNEL